MKGFIDLHCHVLPGVDDGPETMEEAVELVQGLAQLGFSRLIATPHVHPPRWDQHLPTLLTTRDRLVEAVGSQCPKIDIAAENFFDDTIWKRYRTGELLRYPGGKAALVEISSGADDVPLRFEDRLFEMNVNGLRPVLAHPERQNALSTDRSALEKIARGGTMLLISVSSLAGFFGGLRRRAESIIKWAQPLAVASDAHSADEITTIARGLKRLGKIVGEEGLEQLLIKTPKKLLGDG